MVIAKEKGYLLALDAGGTMTDTFLIDAGGQFSLGNAVPYVLKNAPCRVILYHQPV